MEPGTVDKTQATAILLVCGYSSNSHYPRKWENTKSWDLLRLQETEFTTSMILPAVFWFYLHPFSHLSCKYRIPEWLRWEKTSRTIEFNLCLLPTLSPAQCPECHVQTFLEHQALAPHQHQDQWPAILPLLCYCIKLEFQTTLAAAVIIWSQCRLRDIMHKGYLSLHWNLNHSKMMK